MLSHTTPSFGLDVVNAGDGLVRVQPQGELDLASSPALAETLRKEIAAGHRVLLDLSGVSFIDSSGLNTILIAIRDSRPGSLQISRVLSASVRQLVELTGVRSMLPLSGG